MEANLRHGAPDAFRLLQGLWTSHIISALAKLGIPDRIGDTPQSAAELAMTTASHERSLHRLLTTAAALGILTEDNESRFGHTPISLALRSVASPSVRGIARFFSDPWHTRAWECLTDCVRTGRPAVDLAFGVSFFEYLARHPEESSTFFQGMTDFSTMEGPAVADAYDFSPFRAICDVGGGLGFLLALILQRALEATGVLFDQPEIIAGARSQSFLEPHRHRLEFVAGNMFESVPSGMDAYILKRIVHDWPDAQCVNLLRHCRHGVNPGGRLLVVEQVILPNDPSAAAKLMDLEMMVLLGGEERQESAFRQIFTEAGWNLTRVIPTQSPMFILEGEPV